MKSSLLTFFSKLLTAARVVLLIAAVLLIAGIVTTGIESGMRTSAMIGQERAEAAGIPGRRLIPAPVHHGPWLIVCALVVGGTALALEGIRASLLRQFRDALADEASFYRYLRENARLLEMHVEAAVEWETAELLLADLKTSPTAVPRHRRGAAGGRPGRTAPDGASPRRTTSGWLSPHAADDAFRDHLRAAAAGR